MKQNYHSLTAYKVAKLRQEHQVLDSPKVFDDPIASKIIGVQNSQFDKSKRNILKSHLLRKSRAYLAARSRFVEDTLSSAVNRGIRQYVILGAGLDTFAYRNSYSKLGLKVFEVDYPATQTWKRQLLEKENIPIPDSLTYTDIDFENQSIDNRLKETGFQTSKQTFYSWLGVTMYLEQKIVYSTLKCILSLAGSGSEIVFDYLVSPFSLTLFQRLVYSAKAYQSKFIAEPFKSSFDPNTIENNLKDLGFSEAIDIGPDFINERYFGNRADNLSVHGFMHLVKAQV